MIFETNLALNNLHCRTPTDPSGKDEPYLWAFFVRADGSGIRQRAGDPWHLSANISVSSGSGRPGNLNVESAISGSNIHIPPSVGVFKTGLQPIVLAFAEGDRQIRIFLPGRVAAVCVAIDEESVPRDAMEGAFTDVKALIKVRFDDFFNGQDLQAMANTALASPDPVGALQAAFNESLTKFLASLQQEAVAVATRSALIAVIDDFNWLNPFSIATFAGALLDRDEPIGTARFVLSEKEIIDSNLERPLHGDLRQSRDGLGGAWYVLDGYLDSTMMFTSVDINMQYLPATSTPLGEPEEYTFRGDRLQCVSRGTKVPLVRTGNAERVQFFVEYPFANYRYRLDGQEMDGATGTVTLTKEVRFQEFDEAIVRLSSPFVRYRREIRQVKVRFQKRRIPEDPQIEQLILTNDPNDGSFDVILEVEALFNGAPTIPAGTEVIFFEGQTISLPPDFLKQFRDCMENWVGTKWSKSRRVTPIDLWGPVARRRQYEEVANQLDALATVEAFTEEDIEAAKPIIAAKLKISER